MKVIDIGTRMLPKGCTKNTNKKRLLPKRPFKVRVKGKYQMAKTEDESIYRIPACLRYA